MSNNNPKPVKVTIIVEDDEMYQVTRIPQARGSMLETLYYEDRVDYPQVWVDPTVRISDPQIKKILIHVEKPQKDKNGNVYLTVTKMHDADRDTANLLYLALTHNKEESSEPSADLMKLAEEAACAMKTLGVTLHRD